MDVIVGVLHDGGSDKATSGDAKGVKMGVSMPTKSLQRWNQDGANMEKKLREKGYDVDLQFAENKVETQVSQIENMITKGCKVLVVRSGQMTREQCATPNWDEAKAQERMDNILTTYYTGAKLDAVLCSNDSVSLGVQSALKSAGYNTADRPMPVITGQDANLPNVKAIVAGEQSMSVFKDTRALADQVVKMVDAILAKQQPEVNNTKDYNNGVKVVPSYLLEPKFVDKSNYKQLLIDSGYYTEAELQK